MMKISDVKSVRVRECLYTADPANAVMGLIAMTREEFTEAELYFRVNYQTTIAAAARAERRMMVSLGC